MGTVPAAFFRTFWSSGRPGGWLCCCLWSTVEMIYTGCTRNLLHFSDPVADRVY